MGETDLEQAVRTLVDRAEITDLVYRYAKGLADGDVDMIVSVFAPDARLDHDYVVIEGHAGIHRHFSANKVQGAAGTGIGLETFLSRNPLISNVVIDLDGDHARAESRGIVVHHGVRGARHYVVVRSLTYDDDVVRTADGWRIARRHHPHPTWSMEFDVTDDAHETEESR